MTIELVATQGEACKFCENKGPYILKGTDLKTTIWYCPNCLSIWGSAGSAEEAEALIQRLSPRAS